MSAFVYPPEVLVEKALIKPDHLHGHGRQRVPKAPDNMGQFAVLLKKVRVRVNLYSSLLVPFRSVSPAPTAHRTFCVIFFTDNLLTNAQSRSFLHTTPVLQNMKLMKAKVGETIVMVMLPVIVRACSTLSLFLNHLRLF